MKRVPLNLEFNPYFNKEAKDYTQGNTNLHPFQSFTPLSEESVNEITRYKSEHFGEAQRQLIHDVVSSQYKQLGLEPDKLVQNNIKSLLDPNTFTVTTGQQIHIFFGPLFFLYKVISVIGTANGLNKKHPSKHFVPVFWMASEDHDFEEISSIEVYGKKVEWEEKSGNAVGRMNPTKLVQLCDELESILDKNDENKRVIDQFRQAYQTSASFAEATQKLLYQVSRETGLLVLEPDDKRLKESLKPIIQTDLFEDKNEEALKLQTKAFKAAGYKPQIGAQAINFFYFKDSVRHKIKQIGDQFQIGNEQYDRDQMLKLIESKPEDFSPNVALRPLYQELTLPNIAYIAGTSELRYWLQLQGMFAANELIFPIVLLRRSFLLISEKSYTKALNKLNQLEDLFLSDTEIAHQYDSKVNSDLVLAEESLQEGKSQLEAIKEKIAKLPLQRVPFNAYKQIDKAFNQISQALGDVDLTTGGISAKVKDAIQFKNKTANPEKIQERNVAVATQFALLDELMQMDDCTAFETSLQLLIH